VSSEAHRTVRATYRLQLTPDFGFADAERLIDHLAGLGVSHLYLSPLLTAREGSTHGYDVADPTTVSAALGGEEGLRALAERAHTADLGLIGDIVPNHVGTGPENPLWMALLAEGQGGDAGGVFDVDWDPALPGAAGKVIVPVLGEPYGVILDNGELQVVEQGGEPVVRYHDHCFPLSAESREALARNGGVEAFRGAGEGNPGPTRRLHALLEQQRYRLVHWRVGDAVVNYRRFFAINELAAVRVEDPDVFERTHATILRLVREGILDGLRIDHIDGLTDPAAYLARLQGAVPGAWIVAEKILAPDEQLPDWAIAGGTGYDFLGDVLRLQIDPAAEHHLTETAQAFDAWPAAPSRTGAAVPEDHEQAIRDAKHEIMNTDLLADTDRVSHRLWALCAQHPTLRDVDWHACRAVVTGTIAELGVYRTYARPGEAGSEEDVARLRAAVDAARDRASGTAPDRLWGVLVDVVRGDLEMTPQRDELVRRFQQLSGAVMAKGFEDTFLYRQHRLTAMNEVGVEPEPFGGGPAVFHDGNRRRAEAAPQAMLTTATHDTKRGEDTRLRIAAISELPERWRTAVGAWVDANRDLLTETARGAAPDAATEYLCYQTLVGVWPLDDVEAALPALAERVTAYLVKATREGGLQTSWTDPDEAFESGIERFVHGLLDPARPFVQEMTELTATTGRIAAVTGLAQVLLRSLSPGVPDTYQGTELWGDDLVDPDNRRPVDFARRRQVAEELRSGVPADELLAGWQDGRIKQWVLGQSLRARRDHPEAIGVDGRYVPLEVTGEHVGHVVAFARVAPDGDALVAVAPRLPGRLLADGWPIGDVWGDTAVDLGAVDVARDLLSGAAVDASGPVELRRLLADLPVALLSR
jgi:(1->4)-alpha-D-glucan 1-alpha-D-glucosylmutase